jgi:hypothetical protein
MIAAKTNFMLVFMTIPPSAEISAKGALTPANAARL